MTLGLSAFPFTPFSHDRVHEETLVRSLQQLARSTVDEITVLGSTGSYMYLERAERARVVELAIEYAGAKPVGVGVGALRTSDVLQNITHAESVGAQRVLLAPVGYQPLTDDEVMTLFRQVTEHTALPVVVYDNPRTTRVTFTPELLARVCELPGIGGVKLSPPPANLAAARAHIAEIRAIIPSGVSLGVSGDDTAAIGLSSGCDTWYSVLAGVLPEQARAIAAPALAGDSDTAIAASHELDALWQLFREHGSYRVAAAMAEWCDLAPQNSLPLPLLGLRGESLTRLRAVMAQIAV